MKKLLFTLIALFILNTSFGQLVVNNSTLTPAQLVQNVLLGSGVTAFNITYNGSAAAANTVQLSAGTFNGTNSNVGLNSGVIMGSGNVTVAIGPNNQGGASLGGNGLPGVDPDLAAITTNQIYDEAILEFDFIPQGDSIKFQYVFASEEYDEYVCGSVNDAFGFFISGPGFAGPFTNGGVNIALIPGTNTPVSINTVNLGVAGVNGTAATCNAIDPNWSSYNVYYSQNTQQSVQYDGMTVVLTAKASVTCGLTYHIKIGIGDAGDGAWDSGVFLQEGSFGSDQIAISSQPLNSSSTVDVYETCDSAYIVYTFIRPVDTSVQVYYLTPSGSATEGLDYSNIPDSIVMPIGVDTLQFVVDVYDDDMTAGIEPPENIILSTSYINDCGFNVSIDIENWILEPDFTTSSTDVLLSCPQQVNINSNPVGGTTPYTYQWSTGGTSAMETVPGASGSYIVVITDFCGLSISDTINVILNQPPPPTINIIQDSIFQCFGSPSNINSSVTNGATPITYNWSTGGTTSSISYSATADGFIYLTAVDNCGEVSNQDSIYINVSDELFVSVNDLTVLCPGDTAILIGSAIAGSPPYNYSWSISGTDSINIVTPNSTTNYIFTVTDGCQAVSDTATVTVPLYGPIDVTVSGDSLVCYGNSSIYLFSTSGGAGQNNIVWSNSVGGNVISANTTYNIEPTLPGYITVNITDQCGNTGSDSLLVSLQFCEIIIPNVFSPNGDGVNDFFHVLNLEIFENTTLLIYNRWGNLVYENSDYKNNWNGDGLSDGTYYYILKPTHENLEEQHGNVTIIR